MAVKETGWFILRPDSLGHYRHILGAVRRLPSALILLMVCFFETVTSGAAPGFVVKDFTPITNVTLQSGKLLMVDLDSALMDGIRIPTYKQSTEQAFRFTFSISGATTRKLRYKIYYQNEDYKYPESKNPSTKDRSSGNFYGSWGEVDYGFKEIPVGDTLISDVFRIVGNPRNEKRYFGQSMEDYPITESEISNQMNTIRSSPDWMKSISRKAEKNKVTLDRQLRMDAIYSLGESRDKGTANHRWKRNPRMGRYSVMLVVCTADDLRSIPESVSDITKTGANGFVNPFQYFLKGNGRHLKETMVLIDTAAVVLSASIDFSKGIYIDRASRPVPYDFTGMNANCNASDSMFRTAQVEQFSGAEDASQLIKAIPEIKDIPAGEFSPSDYEAAMKKYSGSELVMNRTTSATCPCKTIRWDSLQAAIEIRNPGNEDVHSAVKENAGVRSRVGFTYGKFTARIAFPRQLNSYSMWNGVSNSFWLVFQDKQVWNYRSESVTGYTEKGAYSPDAPRKHSTYYAEIDLELTKASKYWPKEVYFGQNGPTDTSYGDHHIVAALTNWDLADQDPSRYAKGFCPVYKEQREFRPFRWEYFHQALTDRKALDQEEIYGRGFYYYQIEWTPTAITWRIGPSRDQLKIIGYMDETVTAIPDNQMLMVISQEYHPSEWLPPMPFRQEYIPFLKNDLVGKVYEMTIE